MGKVREEIFTTLKENTFFPHPITKKKLQKPTKTAKSIFLLILVVERMFT